MLQKLSISNYALIDNLEISFDSGLNILTGETGNAQEEDCQEECPLRARNLG